MSAGVQKNTSNQSSSSNKDHKQNNQNNRPSREGFVHNDVPLLTAVGKVVVPSAHVVPFAGFIHSENSSIEIRSASSVEFQAVSHILVIVGILKRKAILLVNERHSLLSSLVLKHRVIRITPRVVVVLRENLGDVRSIGLGASFTVVVRGVGVTASPLEVNVVASRNVQAIRNKVVLHSGIDLDDVSALSANVQVPDRGVVVNVVRALADFKHVRAVLESASVLVGVESEFVKVAKVLDNRVLLDRGKRRAVGSRIDEPFVVVQSPSFVVASGNDVTQAKHTVLVRVVRNRPVEARSVSAMEFVHRVSEVVVSSPLSLFTDRRVDVPSGSFDPGTAVLSAGSLVVVVSNGAVVFGLDVLAFLLEKVAVVFVVDEDSDVFPWGRMPVRVVVTFFRALESVSVSVVVLAGVDSGITTVHVLVGSEETSVAFARFAVLVVLVVFVHAVLEDLFVLSGDRIFASNFLVVGGRVVWDCGRHSSVSNFGSTHVLDNDVTVDFRVSASVLVGPLDHEVRADVEVHRRSPAVATLVIVLCITQSVCIVSVLTSFVQTIVRTSWVV